MFVMTHEILIGGNLVPLVTSVSVKMAVDQLCNTATIELPATAFKRRLSQVADIRRGQRVSISLGYDNINTLEFEGYVNRRTDKDGGLLVECEDAMYLFRHTTMENQELANPSMTSILDKVIQAVNANTEDDNEATITRQTDMDYKYEKFVFQNASAYDVLKKIQEETKAHIYLDAFNCLHVEPQYMEKASDVVKYSFQRNICRDGLSLTWKDMNDNPLLVEVEGTGKQDKKVVKVVVSAGKTGGDRIKEKIRGITDKKTLQSIADNMYKGRNYTGFEGSFDAWLRPFVTAGDFVQLTDDEDETRNGKYYVKSVETTFDSGGGKRKINLGNKV